LINVTKTFLPPFEEYAAVLKRAWNKGWITNNGELVKELEEKLKEYLGVEYLLYCSNGTIVLQMALKALNITKEVITTPFSYIATANAILWENCTPVFVDIEPDTFCINANKIEDAITENTQAILATHVYGFACDINSIQKIADKYNLKVIYDGAHAFGCRYKGISLLNFGDISTCSFHATKIFHTGEGGAVICKDKELFDKLYLYRQFGHIYDDYLSIGINAKNSELHAAMGLCILPKVADIIAKRKLLTELYNNYLSCEGIKKVIAPSFYDYNYGYYPVLFESEELLMRVKDILSDNKIFCRRYFYPSLNQLPYLNPSNCFISEDISSRILCLPLYTELAEEDVIHISSLVLKSVSAAESISSN
jgi:dTDP-4-amino-4,6-dideoxygalactose transaminase